MRAATMALLTALFTARVAGQALQRWAPQPWLPPFERWQGSGTPYGILLAAQLLLVAAMTFACIRAARGTLRLRPRTARGLSIFGALYLAGSLARIALGLAAPSLGAWFTAWISAVFHVVLALFVLLVSRYDGREQRSGEAAR